MFRLWKTHNAVKINDQTVIKSLVITTISRMTNVHGLLMTIIAYWSSGTILLKPLITILMMRSKTKRTYS